MAKLDNKNRPIAVKTTAINWNPLWSDSEQKFNSDMPSINMYTEVVVDPTDGQTMKGELLYIDLQRQIAEGMLTIEQITEAISVFRLAMYNQVDLDNLPTEEGE